MLQVLEVLQLSHCSIVDETAAQMFGILKL